MFTPGGGGYGEVESGSSNAKKRRLNHEEEESERNVSGAPLMTSAGSLNQYKMNQESV